MYATPEDRPIYRLLTGADDRAFCERVSEALEQGWRLYGSPAMTYDAATGAIKVPADYCELGALFITVALLGLALPFAAIALVRLARLRSA